MKTISIFILSILTVLVITSFNRNTGTIISLSDAVSQGKVEVNIKNTGGFSGKCINALIKNLTNTDLTIVVYPGTTFVPEDEGEQTLVTPAKQVIALIKNQARTVAMEAYCTEAHDRSPDQNSKFALSSISNPQLKSFFLKANTFGAMGSEMIQEAIWCITDSSSVSNLYHANPTIQKNVRQYICTLTGQQDTWYTTRRNFEVGEDRRIVDRPQVVKGKILMDNKEPIELNGMVKNGAGEVVLAYQNHIKLPAGKMEFDFELKVSGWVKGDYYVVYIDNKNQEIYKQKFSF